MTKGYVKSVTELIGQSPVVKLKRMVPEGAADVLLNQSSLILVAV